MARVTPGTPSWGDDLNADLDGVEAIAQEALALAEEVSAQLSGVDFDASMTGFNFMSGTSLPTVDSVPANTLFFLLPEA